MKAKVGIYELYFGNISNHKAEIRRDTIRCWQKCCNFHNLARSEMTYYAN